MDTTPIQRLYLLVPVVALHSSNGASEPFSSSRSTTRRRGSSAPGSPPPLGVGERESGAVRVALRGATEHVDERVMHEEFRHTRQVGQVGQPGRPATHEHRTRDISRRRRSIARRRHRRRGAVRHPRASIAALLRPDTVRMRHLQAWTSGTTVRLPRRRSAGGDSKLKHLSSGTHHTAGRRTPILQSPATCTTGATTRALPLVPGTERLRRATVTAGSVSHPAIRCSATVTSASSALLGTGSRPLPMLS